MAIVAGMDGKDAATITAEMAKLTGGTTGACAMCLAENQATPDKIMSACMGGGHHDDHDGPQCSMADGMVLQGVENADDATQMAAMAKVTKSCSACVMAKGTSGGDVEDCFDPSAMQA